MEEKLTILKDMYYDVNRMEDSEKKIVFIGSVVRFIHFRKYLLTIYDNRSTLFCICLLLE